MPGNRLPDAAAHKLAVTVFPDEHALVQEPNSFSLPELAALIRNQSAANKSDLPSLKLGTFGSARTPKGCLRHNANVQRISGIEVDYDAGKIPFEAAVARMEKAGLRCILYTTPSYRAGTNERWRILVPLSTEREPEIHEKMVARINGLFDGQLANESFTLSQAYYFGKAGDTELKVEGLDGDFLDLRDDLYAGSIFKHGTRVGATEQQRSNPYATHVAHGGNGAWRPQNTEPVDLERLQNALDAIDANCPYEQWLKIAGALYAELGESGFPIFDSWSSRAQGRASDGTPMYTPAKTAERWHGARGMRDVSISTVFYYAAEEDPDWEHRAAWVVPGRAATPVLGVGVRTLPGAITEPAEQPFLTGRPKAIQAPAPLGWLSLADWDDVPTPEREWTIRDRVPKNQAGLFSGEGGTGKSILELMKAVAHVAGKDWLGSLPEPGGAFYLAAEDDEVELHIRLAAIAKHYGVTFAELEAGGLKILPLLGQDAVLCAPLPKSGRVETTALYKQVYEAAGDLKPRNQSIDTLSRAFAGSEIDRGQVYGFAMHMQALAKVAGGSVTVLSHPSLTGIATGTGLSGSTAWHGAFRFRQYLTTAKATGDEAETDPTASPLREFQFLKNQYGKCDDAIQLRYQGGLFLPVVKPSSIQTAAKQAQAQRVFLACLRTFTAQGRYVSDNPRAHNSAPAAFAKTNEAASAELTAKDFVAAMEALFATGEIAVEQHGKPSRQVGHLVEKQGVADGSGEVEP